MKKEYIKPELETISFEIEEIITAIGEGEEISGGDIPLD